MEPVNINWQPASSTTRSCTEPLWTGNILGLCLVTTEEEINCRTRRDINACDLSRLERIETTEHVEFWVQGSVIRPGPQTFGSCFLLLLSLLSAQTHETWLHKTRPCMFFSSYQMAFWEMKRKRGETWWWMCFSAEWLKQHTEVMY